MLQRAWGYQGDAMNLPVADLSAALVSADDKEVEVLAVCDMGNNCSWLPEFEDEFAGKACSLEFFIHFRKKFVASLRCIFLDHLHLEFRNHSVGELLIVDDIEQGEFFGKTVFERNDCVNGCMCSG